MKLPKGHIVKTSVKYDLKMNSFKEFIKEILEDDDKFTGYMRIIADKGDYEEEFKVILSEGEPLGGERKLLNSETVFYGDECKLDEPFEFCRCGVSVVRLTSSDIDMVKGAYPDCIIVKDLGAEKVQVINHRDQLLKKYRIREMNETEITNLLQKLNGD